MRDVSLLYFLIYNSTIKERLALIIHHVNEDNMKYNPPKQGKLSHISGMALGGINSEFMPSAGLLDVCFFFFRFHERQKTNKNINSFILIILLHKTLTPIIKLAAIYGHKEKDI